MQFPLRGERHRREGKRSLRNYKRKAQHLVDRGDYLSRKIRLPVAAGEEGNAQYRQTTRRRKRERDARREPDRPGGPPLFLFSFGSSNPLLLLLGGK